MNKKELIEKLNTIGIKARQYSLDGELKPDAIILYPNYHKWEVFYLDERGGRNVEKEFTSEEEALNYIYELFWQER